MAPGALKADFPESSPATGAQAMASDSLALSREWLEAPDALRHWRIWLLVILLTLLLHLAVLISRFHWQAHPSAVPRVDIQQVDPAKLAAIRRQWAQKGLLLDTDKNRPNEKEAPKNARYMSDKNIHVEKETRGKSTDVLPKPGALGPQSQASQQRQRLEKVEKAPSHPLPKLGDLGVPFKFNSKPPAPADQQQQEASQGGGGSNQDIEDKNIPEGSQTLLNAEESVYYSFFARLYEAIGPVWQSRIRSIGPRKLQPGDYSTQVDVVLDAQGNLIEVRKLASSTIPEFDSAVDQAWHTVGRFPNPPKELLDAQGQIHTGWTFTVHVGQGFNLNYMPPERTY